MFMTKGYVQRNIWQEVVPWAVLPLMIKLAGATFASSQSRSMGDFLTQPGTSNVADVAYMAVLGCSLCIIMLVYARSMIHEFCQAYLVTFLLVFITLTAAWSQSPLHTLKQAFWLWISVGFTYWLMVRFTPKQQMEMLMLTGTLSAVLCILAVVFIPSAGLDALHEFSWQGVFYSKNHMGRIFLFLLTAGIHYNGKTPVERCFRLAYIFLTLFMIAMSQSKSAWLFTIGYLFFAFLLMISSKITKRDLYPIVIVSGMAVAVSAVAIVLNLDAVLSLFGRDSTLTGRTEIWKILMLSALKRPLYGFGYDAFWAGHTSEGMNAFIAVYGKTGFMGSYAHSGYLATLLEEGAIGLLLILALIVRGLKDSFVCLRCNSGINNIHWYISILFLTIIYNVDEVTFVLPYYLPWMMFVLAVNQLSVRSRLVRMDAAHA